MKIFIKFPSHHSPRQFLSDITKVSKEIIYQIMRVLSEYFLSLFFIVLGMKILQYSNFRLFSLIYIFFSLLLSRQRTTKIKIYKNFLGFLRAMAEARERGTKTDDRCTHCKRNEQNCRLVERESAIYFELIVFLFFINFMMLLSKILPSFFCVFVCTTRRIKKTKNWKCSVLSWKMVETFCENISCFAEIFFLQPFWLSFTQTRKYFATIGNVRRIWHMRAWTLISSSLVKFDKFHANKAPTQWLKIILTRLSIFLGIIYWFFSRSKPLLS